MTQLKFTILIVLILISLMVLPAPAQISNLELARSRPELLTSDLIRAEQDESTGSATVQSGEFAGTVELITMDSTGFALVALAQRQEDGYYSNRAQDVYIHLQGDVARQKMFDMLLHAMGSKLIANVHYDPSNQEIQEVILVRNE